MLRAGLAGLALMLASCAGLQPSPSVSRTPPPVKEFRIDGRVAVRQGETRHFLNIAWRHDAAGDEIFLTTPLGQGVAQLNRDAGGARLLTADRREFAAADWEGLAEQVFGTRLPLNDLSIWVTGQAGDTARGWRVEYLDYQSTAPDAMPVLIEASRNDTAIRLKIDEWSQVR